MTRKAKQPATHPWKCARIAPRANPADVARKEFFAGLRDYKYKNGRR